MLRLWRRVSRPFPAMMIFGGLGLVTVAIIWAATIRGGAPAPTSSGPTTATGASPTATGPATAPGSASGAPSVAYASGHVKGRLAATVQLTVQTVSGPQPIALSQGADVDGSADDLHIDHSAGGGRGGGAVQGALASPVDLPVVTEQGSHVAVHLPAGSRVDGSLSSLHLRAGG